MKGGRSPRSQLIAGTEIPDLGTKEGGEIDIKRPLFLTIWLSLMTLGGVYSLYSYTIGLAMITAAFPNSPSWIWTLFALFSVVNLVAIVLLWMWKKVGFYLVIGSAIMAATLNGMILGAAAIGASIFAIIGVGILYLAMKPVWQNFK